MFIDLLCYAYVGMSLTITNSVMCLKWLDRKTNHDSARKIHISDQLVISDHRSSVSDVYSWRGKQLTDRESHH